MLRKSDTDRCSARKSQSLDDLALVCSLGVSDGGDPLVLKHEIIRLLDLATHKSLDFLGTEILEF